MQNVAAYLYRAKQKSGKNHLFTYFEAKSDDHAETKRDFLFMEAGHSKSDYFAPVRIDFPVVDELPAEGEFSETFWLTWALESDASKTCVPRDTLDPSVAFPKLYPYMTKPAGGAGAAENSRTTEKTQVVQEQQKTAGEYFASSLDKHTVIAAAWLYGNNCLKLNDEQLAAAKALVMDDAQRYPQNVILALTSLKQFAHTYPEMPITAISGMKAIWPPFGKVPELGKLCQFATEYLDATVEQRAGVITKWQTSAAGGAKPAETAPEGPLRTESGAILTNGAEPATGTPIDSLQMLETVIGCALYPSDFDISNPPGAIIRAVTEMKKRNDAALKAWNEQLSATPGVLQFSRQAIVALIRGAEENLHVTPGALRSYINANLIEIDGKPAQKNAESVQQTGAEAQQTASNPGEKDDVVAEFETERRAWLRAEIRAALAGTTGVMDERDVAELITAIGDVSHGSIARLLAKEIEPCDPFNQLVADDVHHLTCDVLENWQDEKDPRVAYIDSRVEFYLQEARRESERKYQELATATDASASGALQQENPAPERVDASNEGVKTEVAQQQPSELRSMGGGRFDVSELFDASPLAKVDAAGATTGDDVREFLDSSTETAEVSGETAELSGENVDTAAPVEVQNEPAAAVVNAPRREEPAAPAYFEPGRYLDIPNEVYHSANGISSTMAKDARISLMYYHGRHVIKTIQRERTDALTFGSLVHALALEPEKLDEEFSVEPVIPEGAFTDTASMRAFIEQHNATLPKQTDAETLRAVIEKHNATLQAPYALGGNADEIGQFYMLLPPEFQSIPEDAKITATAMKACIKEYNATLPAPLKTTGGRDALLEQLATIDPEFVEKERAIPAPLPVSGSKEDMAARIKTILPTAVFADEVISAWKNGNDQRQPITQAQMKHAKAIQRALFTHPSVGQLLQNPQRAVEVSYFGIDEETGLELRVRPDLEIEAVGLRIGYDLKTVSMGNVKQSALRARLHREIIERDYHLSAGMYCDVAALDQFFWIFVNKDEHYHWIAIVEASADLLELGRLEYRKTLRDIKQAQDTDVWPEPITEEIVDDINDFDQRRIEALRVA
ncbi:PD-(D/E)XK nuclease-like domain-containing protein [Serratia marcescens]|uniref:PD-(D/E)XK nuclease-like domain-containing protein n=1 Tax=Serratia marcescens TaxID=615 RepID=UPI00221E73A8|nr:PD-(D/E)XK nuclease-like domain-containing protein [Serratia marcescens]MDP8610435.1 PD-(D/E)XK nuclease-like domain-containing protein [Serratia marcescens]MDP8680088.1 PD-(D/E)XK nuclease-like domain-containing protein [Serratia marcescens]MDS0829101.1 PD-(D/E)XK nuclease-like domain-containing protein [Serratia marcescens]UYU01883.1 PD-(D/E)XK nuclease-like domain-containing protein [Serratia marcescens]HEJ7901945.1 PD-(D/E)XK nuclease-like domain-containing protein [Serratia marcescens]